MSPDRRLVLPLGAKVLPLVDQHCWRAIMTCMHRENGINTKLEGY